MTQLTDEEVEALLDGMRLRDQIRFKSAKEYERVLDQLTREELISLLVKKWQRDHEH